MYLYLYQDESKEKVISNAAREDRIAFRDKLVRKALSDYSKRISKPLSDDLIQETTIKKEPKGKPYFADLPYKNGKPLTEVHYSVSHSGDWWGCLMAKEPVGFDLEICRNEVHFEKIAKRFFTGEEHEWIKKMGSEGFFDIWVRKEAFVKYLGSGLGEGLSSFSVIENGKLTVKVTAPKHTELRRPPGKILTCNVAEGVKAAYCSRSGTSIQGLIMLEPEGRAET